MVVRTPIGTRIRRKRMASGMSQAALATDLGISPSYLNLIENNKRAIGGSLLLRIGERLGVDMAYLSDESEVQALATINELMFDPVMQGIEVAPGDVREVVSRFPEFAAALTRFYRAYTDASANIEALHHRLKSDPFLSSLLHEILNRVAGIKSSAEIVATTSDLTLDEQQRFASNINSEAEDLVPTLRSLIGYFDTTSSQVSRPVSPMTEIDDAIIANENYFPALEDVADNLARELGPERPLREAALSELLARKFAISCRLSSERAVGNEIAPERLIVLPAAATSATRVFRMLRIYAQRSAGAVLDEAVASLNLVSDEAKLLARQALASYIAGAIMMPYGQIHELAEERRYDIELIGNLIGANFEQVAQRIVSLRRKGQEGVPFGFLRADFAGRLTKRFTLPGLVLPAAGHGCLLWPIYRAFSTPGVVRQISVFPSGSRFLQIARQVVKYPAGYQRQSPTFSIMLSCDMLHADRTVYGQGMESAFDNVEAGPSCLLCSRLDCSHRNEAAA
jgi:predicted transcriptional regulator/transcriptional regulator with XRE-family HTH domain